MSSNEGSVALEKPTSNTVRYLVLESGQRTPITRILYEHGENPEWVYLFADTDWQLYLDESPVILKAAQKSSEYQWALKGLKSGELTGLILESQEEIEAVAAWLRARLKVRFDGHRQGLIRFYDPKIWHCLSPASHQDINVVERVIYWYGDTGEEQWLITERPSPFNMSPVPTLNETQWQALSTVTA